MHISRTPTISGDILVDRLRGQLRYLRISRRAKPGFYVTPGRPFHDRADGSGSTRAQRTLFAALGLRVTSSLVETETCVVLWREPRLSSQREAQRRACAPSGHALRPPCPLRRQVGMLVEAIDALSCDRSGARTPCSSDS